MITKEIDKSYESNSKFVVEEHVQSENIYILILFLMMKYNQPYVNNKPSNKSELFKWRFHQNKLKLFKLWFHQKHLS